MRSMYVILSLIDTLTINKNYFNNIFYINQGSKLTFDI